MSTAATPLQELSQEMKDTLAVLKAEPRPGGVGWKAACPFADEHKNREAAVANWSVVIDPGKQVPVVVTCRNFEEHDVNSWVRNEIARCKKEGIPLTASNRALTAKPKAKIEFDVEKQTKIVAAAHEQLLKNQRGLDYLKGRGINETAIKGLRLGYIPNYYFKPGGVGQTAVIVFPHSVKARLAGMKLRALSARDHDTRWDGETGGSQAGVYGFDLLLKNQSAAQSEVIFDDPATLPPSQVLIVEGMMDVALGVSYGFTTVGLPYSGGKLNAHEIATLSKFDEIYLIGDTDACGVKAMQRVREQLKAAETKIIRVTVGAADDLGDLRARELLKNPDLDFGDLLRALMSAAKELRDNDGTFFDNGNKMKLWAHKTLNTKSDSHVNSIAGAKVIRMSDVVKKKQRWLWENRLPLGAMSTIAGDPDKGKSLVTLYIAARVTKGEPLYGNVSTVTLPPSDVLILSAEDDPETTLSPRLEAAGADLSRIWLLESVVVKDGTGKTFEQREAQLDYDIGEVRKILADHPNIRLIIIDPISSFLGNAGMNKEQEVRKVLRPIRDIAQSLDISVILVAHFNKVTEAKAALDRVGGAKAIVGYGRAAWTCMSEPKPKDERGNIVERADYDPNRFLFLKLKNNLAPTNIGGLIYAIKVAPVEVMGETGPETTNQPYIEWIKETDSTAQDLLIDGSAVEGKKETAKAWLSQHLTAAGGSAMRESIMSAGAAAGQSERTLQRAKDELKLDSHLIKRMSYWSFSGVHPEHPDPEFEPVAESDDRGPAHGGKRPGAGRKPVRKTNGVESPEIPETAVQISDETDAEAVRFADELEFEEEVREF